MLSWQNVQTVYSCGQLTGLAVQPLPSLSAQLGGFSAVHSFSWFVDTSSLVNVLPWQSYSLVQPVDDPASGQLGGHTVSPDSQAMSQAVGRLWHSPSRVSAPKNKPIEYL